MISSMDKPAAACYAQRFGMPDQAGVRRAGGEQEVSMLRAKKWMPVAVVGLMLAGARVHGAGAIVGYVSDEKCAMTGSKSAKASEWIKPAAFEACVKDCMKQGSEPV